MTQTIAMVSSVGGLAAADGSAFFTNPVAGTVVRVDRDRSEHVIGHGLQPRGLAVRDGQVFWTNSGMTIGEQADGSLATARTDGSGERVLLEGLSQPAGIAVDAEHVYFSSAGQVCSGTTPPAATSVSCNGGGVVAWPRAGGAAIVIDPHSTAVELALGAQAVFWMAGGPTRVVSAPLAGTGPARTRVESFDEYPGSIAVDDTALYFASSERGRVMKLPHAASELTPIAVDLGELVGDIAVNARGVYVAATSLGQILRFAKDGSAARTDEAITGPCPMPLGTAEDLAASPREDKSLEQLALQLDSERVVASQETYDRILADVQAIRELDMELADVNYTAHDDAQTIILTMSDLAFQSVEAGTYSAWDCLTSFYGLVRQHSMTVFGRHFVELTLDGNYNVQLLAKQVFAKLPGVKTADPNGIGGDGPTICARREGETMDYVVDRRDGDCFVGCYIHHAKHFVSSSRGVVEAGETWDSETEMSVPAWYQQICPR